MSLADYQNLLGMANNPQLSQSEHFRALLNAQSAKNAYPSNLCGIRQAHNTDNENKEKTNDELLLLIED